jgi:hypothetical protein
MKVMVLVKASKESETGVAPDEKLISEMMAYNEQLVKAGVMLAGEGLKASSEGKRVRFAGPRRTVIDGPFAETKELLAGFWLWQVRNMDEAIEWAKRCPNPHPDTETTELEIRPVFESVDCTDVSVDIKEKEERLRAEMAAQRRS